MDQRTDTAHLAWDKRWRTEEGRADWLAPEPDVREMAERVYAAGGRRALDLGCGVGRHALMLAEIGFETHALDASDAGLEQLGQSAAERGLDIAAHNGLMTELPFADGVFDYVLSFNVIYHGDPGIVGQAIAEISRVLKPGGTYQGTMLSKRNANFGKGTEVAPDTFADAANDDKDHPHFYCDAAGLVRLFAGFELWSLTDQLHKKPGSWHWHMAAEKQ